MDRERLQAAAMDREFTALLTRWQDAIVPTNPGPTGTAGTTLGGVCRSLKDWLGPSITTRDASNSLVERLDPERLCARMTDLARDARVSRPQTMLAVLALIDRIVAAGQYPNSEKPAQLWAQYLEESWLSKAWAGDFKPEQRSFR